MSKQKWGEHLVDNQSIITDVYMGQTISKLQCTECSTATYNFQPFYLLELSLPVGQGQISLTELLDYQARSEVLEGFKWNCPQCKTVRTAKRSCQIYKLPVILAVCIKRFNFVDGKAVKNDCLVKVNFDGENLYKYEVGAIPNKAAFTPATGGQQSLSNLSKIYKPYLVVVIYC